MLLTMGDLEKELNGFKAELARGAEMVEKLEAQLAALRQTILRIEGAKMLTEKLLAKEKAEQDDSKECSVTATPQENS